MTKDSGSTILPTLGSFLMHSYSSPTKRRDAEIFHLLSLAISMMVADREARNTNLILSGTTSLQPLMQVKLAIVKL